MTTPERDLPSVLPRPRDEDAILVAAVTVSIAVVAAIWLGAWLLIERLTSASAFVTRGDRK